jgi:chorismate mutase
MAEPDPDQQLQEMRRDIDRIDLAIHRLLMERGEIIDHLIAIKARQGGGSAFRPGREASMMRAMAERHRGLLPLDTVEGIWRIIISTFTYVQANYSVHADVSGGDSAMRDSVRFHFGFTVPFLTHNGPRAVIEAVARSGGDLGMVRLDSGPSSGPWWDALAEADAPKIIARLPFVERPDHPAGMPAFVLSQPLAEAAATEVRIRAIQMDRWREGIPAALAGLGAEMLGNAAGGVGLSLMVAAPGSAGVEALADALRSAGASGIRIRDIGSHASRFEAPSRAPAQAR